jgi:hypothetical protein
MSYPIAEVLGRVERRRRFSVEQKIAVLAEATAPGANMSKVARRHHPLVADLLAAHRAIPPENIGLAVASGNATRRGVITCWLVNARMPKGEQRVFLQPIAIRDDGRRMPPWERQLDQHLHGMAAPPRWTEAQRLACLRDQIEPALDRETQPEGRPEWRWRRTHLLDRTGLTSAEGTGTDRHRRLLVTLATVRSL